MAIVMADAVLRLVKNRSVREVAPPLSESAPDLTLDQGYAIQRALERALCEREIESWVGRPASPTPRCRRATEFGSRCWAFFWARARSAAWMPCRCRAS